MIGLLLLGTAFAEPPRVSFAIGPAVGVGTSTHGDYFTAAPITAGTVTWNIGPFQSWLGLSGSLLMAGQGEAVVPSSLLEAEAGVGFGGRSGGGGVYGGSGWPGPIVGLYGYGMVHGPGWISRVGPEARLFYTQATDSTGFALMVRVEPGRSRADRRRPAPERPPYPPEAPRPAQPGAAPSEPAAAEPVGEEEAPSDMPLAIPVDGLPAATPATAPVEEPEAEPAAEPAPSGADVPPATHHDEPY